MTVLGALAGRRDDAEQRAISSVPWDVWPGDNYGPTWSGSPVNSQNSLQLLTVYGCVRLIVDAISTLPLDVFRKRPDGTRETMPTPSWLAQPMLGMSRIAWLSQVLTSLLLDGNAFIYVKRGQSGIVELEVLEPAAVQVVREQNVPVLYVYGHRPTWEVVHIPALIRPGMDVGVSPVEEARQTIGMGMAAQEYGARFFGQGASLSGVIETPGELAAGKAEEMAKLWAKKHSGMRKSHLPGVLEGGATWKPTGVTNEQAQFLQTRGYTAAEIAGQMFLVDPSDLGIPVNGTSLTYANLEQRNARRLQVTFMPWIVRLEEALSRLLPQPRYVKFNVNGLLRGDLKTQFETWAIGIDKKFMVPNEPRDLMDWAPLPGGDETVEADVPAPAGGTND